MADVKEKTDDELLADYGVTSEEDVKIDGVSNFFEFPLGEHIVLVGDLVYKYKNVEDKPCKKEDAGAKLSYAQQQFIVIKIGDDILVDKTYKLVGDKPPAAYRYSQYVNFESDRQFGNKITFNTFYIDDKPGLSVVKDADGGKFSINLKVAPLYRGFPCTMTVAETVSKKNGKTYKNHNFELSSHKLTKELVTARGKLIDQLNEQINLKWDEQKKETTQEKTSETAASADSVDDAMDGLYD